MNIEQLDLPVDDYRVTARRILSGSSFRISSFIVVRVLVIARLAIFSRLFLPSDIGIANLAVSVVTLISILADFGFGQSVIRKQEFSEDFLNSAFTLSVITGLIIYIATLFSSSLISQLLSANIKDYIRLIAIIIFSVPMRFPNYLWEKEIQFLHPSVVLIVNEASSFVVAIAVELLFHLGVMSLLIGTLSSIVISFAYSWAFTKYKPFFRLNKNDTKAILDFGFPFMVQGMNSSVMSKGDNLLVGAYAGTTQLAYYNFAWQLPTMISTFAQTIESTLFPVYAKINHNKNAVMQLFYSSNKMWSIIGSYFGFGIIIFADAIVNILFGPNWLQVIPLLKVMTLSFIIRYCSGYAYGNLAVVRGRTKYLMKWGIANTIFILTFGQYMIFKYGGIGGAWFWVIQVTLFTPLQRFPLIIQELGSLDVLKYVWQPLAAGICCFAISLILFQQNCGFLITIIEFTIYSILFIAFLFVIDKQLILMAKKIFVFISEG